jgi:hypothetical protein
LPNTLPWRHNTSEPLPAFTPAEVAQLTAERLREQIATCRQLAEGADEHHRRQFLALAAEIEGYADSVAARAQGEPT